MMLPLCTMPTAHYDDVVRVPMPILHPKNWLLVVENGRLFSQRMVRPHIPQTDCCNMLIWGNYFQIFLFGLLCGPSLPHRPN